MLPPDADGWESRGIVSAGDYKEVLGGMESPVCECIDPAAGAFDVLPTMVDLLGCISEGRVTFGAFSRLSQQTAGSQASVL